MKIIDHWLIKSLLFTLIMSTFNIANAQMLGFDCVSEPSKNGGHVWKYNFEISKNLSRGMVYGKTYGGNPFAYPVIVHFKSPEIMTIQNPEKPSTEHGWINRENLNFLYGGSKGKCEIVQIRKRSFPEKKEGAKF